MSNYLIELSAVHVILIGAYWLFLKNENQYGKLRAFILGATCLSLLIPLFKLPKLFVRERANEVAHATELIPLDGFVIQSDASSGFNYDLLLGGYALISLFFLIRFLVNLFHLIRLEHESKSEPFNNTRIRRARGIDGSFTFFNWIFLAEEVQGDNQEYDVILRHEKAHAALGHTYDLIFLELYKIAFWWLPTAWFTQKEIKKIHEYQADAYAVKSYSIDQYSSILISSTLKTNGLSLASSFHDGLIFKRLNAMKQKAKKVSPWKLGMITMLTLTLFVVFACSEESQAQNTEPENSSAYSGETFTKVEEQPEYPGGMDALFSFIGENIKYPEQARKSGIEGKVYVQFIVEKDGAVTNVQSVKGIGAGCDAEAVKAVEALPNFKPGKQRGRAVRVKMVLPVMFALTDNKPEGMGALYNEVKSDFNKMRVAAEFRDGSWLGTVYNAETGDAMPGVNIVEEGTNSGTVSDRDGSFRIKLADEKNDLVFSHVGYQMAKLKVS